MPNAGAFPTPAGRWEHLIIRGKRTLDMKAIIDNMFGYWIILLAISLGLASMIYVFWLRDALLT